MTDASDQYKYVEPKILSILPAEDWYARYVLNPPCEIDEEGIPSFLPVDDDHPRFDSRLACWALIEYPDGLREVVGMAPSYPMEALEPCPMAANFEGYLYKGEGIPQAPHNLVDKVFSP